MQITGSVFATFLSSNVTYPLPVPSINFRNIVVFPTCLGSATRTTEESLEPDYYIFQISCYIFHDGCPSFGYY